MIPAAALETLRRAQEAPDFLLNEQENVSVLAQIARAQAAAGDADGAIGTAEKIADIGERIGVLAEIARELHVMDTVPPQLLLLRTPRRPCGNTTDSQIGSL